MQYLAAVYWDEKRWLALPQAERDRMMAECTAYGGEVRRSGHLLAGAPLHPSSTATTLRRTGDQLVMTDGPFAETKEVLGGYHLFECKDLDEALAVSARWPGLRWGFTLEVRPIIQHVCG
jgi:hypothetical protein